MSDAHQREAAIFDAAIELPPGQRTAYLDQACGGDAALRRRIESLLQADQSRCEFLDPPGESDLRPPPQATAPLTEKPGEMIGRYKLLQQIGEGGCGVVYMAEQAKPVRRRVALKIIKLGMDTKSVVARFEAERQALAMMDHPNIAKVFDAGATENGRPYFVMELVRGIRITDYCDERKLTTEERLRLFIEVCHAIQHAHQKGIIHRDLKPSNILVTLNDGVAVPKVIDFGVAKATNGQQLTDRTLFTAFEQFIGTPAYMSPEQAVLTSLDVDTRSDIYALGVLLYELMTGRPPFDPKKLLAAGLDEMRRTIREAEPHKPSTLISTLPAQELSTMSHRRGLEHHKLASELRGDLDWIVMKALEKDRARRYDTANGLAMDVERHLKDEPVLACPPSKLYELRKTMRRHKAGFAATAAVILVLACGVALTSWQAVRAIRAEREQSRLRESEARQRQAAETNEQRAEQERDRALAAESEAQKQEGLARTFAAESHRRLVRRYVVEGNRLVQEGDLFNALIPFATALTEDQEDASRASLHRLRLAMTLRRCPKLVVACFPEKEVDYAEFSPDDSLFVTASRGKTARVWNAATGAAVTPPLQHSDEVWTARFSPDGQWVVTGCRDGKAQIWNAGTGERVGDPLRHPKAIRSASFSPDGRWLVTTCSDRIANVWDAATGEVRGPPLEHPGDAKWAEFSPDGGRILVTGHNATRVWTFAPEGNVGPSLDLPGSSAALSPDGRRAAIAERGGGAGIWDTISGRQIVTLKVLGEHPRFVFSPDGETVATESLIGEDRLVQIWDAATGNRTAPPIAHPGNNQIKAQSFSPDGRWLLTASGSTVSIWDVETGQLAFPPLTHGGVVRWATFSRSGDQILTASDDCSARIWNLAGDELAQPPVRHPGLVHQIIFPPDARRVLTISVEGTARFWDLETGESSALPEASLAGVAHADFSPDGELLALARINGAARVWNLATGLPVGPPLSHQGRVNSIGFSSDGRRVLTAGADGVVRMWRVGSGEPITQMTHPGPVNLASFTPDGQRVVSTMVNTPDELLWGPRQEFVWPQEGLIANEAGVRYWDATSGQLTAPPLEFANGITEIALSPDRLHAITGCSKHDGVGRLQYTDIWDLTGATADAPRLSHEASLTHGAFSPDGRRVVTSGRDGTTRVWDATTGEMLTPPIEDGFSDCAFSPDGRLVATASSSTSEVRLWDAATGQLVGPPLRVRPGGVVNRIAFSPDGDFLVAATSDNRVQALEIRVTPRPLEHELLLVQMLAGISLDEFDENQGFVRGRLRAAWEELHARYPEEFTVVSEQKLAWLNRQRAQYANQIRALRAEEELAALESLFRKWLGERRKILSDDHPANAAILMDLADVLRDQGKLTEARAELEEALRLRRNAPASDRADTLNAMNFLGIAICEAGKPEEALPLFKKTLEGFEQVYDSTHHSTLAAIHNVGCCYLEMGMSDQGLRLLQQALNGGKETLEPGHSSLMATMKVLAHYYQRLGMLDEALPLFRDRLDHLKETLAPNDPDRLNATMDLAYLLGRKGKWKEAAQEFESLVENVPTNHYNCFVLAPLLVACEDAERYRDLIEDIVARFRDTADPVIAERIVRSSLILPESGADLGAVAGMAAQAADTPDEAHRPWAQLANGWADYRQGRFTRAVEWLEQTLSEAGVRFDRDVQAYSLLAMAYHRLGQPEEASAALALGAVIDRVMLPKPASGDFGQDWQDWIMARALMDEAEALIGDNSKIDLDQTLDEFLSKEPDRHELLILRAGYRAQQGRLSEAAADIRRAHELDPDNPHTLRMMENVAGALAVDVMESLHAGEFAKAEPGARECLRLREKVIPDSWLMFNAKSQLGGSLLGQQKYEEAERLLPAGFEGMSQREDQIPLAARSRLKEALQRLVQLYEETDRPEIATGWRQKLAEFEEAAAVAGSDGKADLK